MYLSRISIKGFRNFKDSEISFTDGLNVIIGHNNAGKTNLIRALALVIDNQISKRLDVDDFNKDIDLNEIRLNPPTISISLHISESDKEDPYSEDLVTVSSWLTRLESPYEALLTYNFFLPEKELEKYRKKINEIDNFEDAWECIKHDFIRLYTYKIYGGDPNLLNIVDSEFIQKIDFQFLNAIRDVERDMFSGRNTLLKEILDFFMDYEIKKDLEKDDDVKNEEISKKKKEFALKAMDLLETLRIRMSEGKKHILSYADETGASFNRATPSFEGSLSDIEIFSALRLVIEYETGIKIPATHNGLGYNNLIFMSLLLAKMQVNSDGKYLGGNAKVFPILVIEEPEAHLHPAMQYKFLNFLRSNISEKKRVRQIFITTHSTQITSSVPLDNIICLNSSDGRINVGYPGKVFPDNDQGKKAKAYVQRFLDATKSDMLFAKSVILVEGIAEQLLLHTFAKYIEYSLEDNHVAVINVGGRYFEHFLYLFDIKDPNAISKRVACLTDRDPERKENGGKFKQCYPFEIDQNLPQVTYKDNATEKLITYNTHASIRFFSQDALKGKTFEYDLALANPTSSLLIVDSLSNKGEINELMSLFDKNDQTYTSFIDRLRGSEGSKRICDAIVSSDWSDEDKKKAIIASRYLNSVSKGGNALELAYILEENLKYDNPQHFNIPSYIKEAIEWVCQ
jgi:putative ATP-dependent endonuclease of OLD family